MQDLRKRWSWGKAVEFPVDGTEFLVERPGAASIGPRSNHVNPNGHLIGRRGIAWRVGARRLVGQPDSAGITLKRRFAKATIPLG